MRSRPMHNIFKGIILSLLLVVPLFSMGKDQVNVLFVKANEQYAKSRFKEAAQTYQEIIDAGYRSAEVYFNIGNANYKLGDMASAILNYEKAYRLAPGDEDISLNLKLANLKITDRAADVPEFFLSSWWKSFTLFFSVSALSLFGVLCLLIGFLLLIVYLFAHAYRIKKTAFITGISIVLMGLASITLIAVQNNYFKAHQEAIVFAGTLNVKSAPNAAQKTLFILHEGTKVRVVEKNEEWIKVELANGNVGWIEASGIKEI